MWSPEYQRERRDLIPNFESKDFCLSTHSRKCHLPLLLPGSWSKEILWPVSFLLQLAESMVEANSSNQFPTARIHSHRGTLCSRLGFNSPKWQTVENTGTLSSSASFKRYMKVYIFSDRKALHVNLVELWEAMEIKFYAIEVFLKAPWKWGGSRTFFPRLICKM